MPARRQQCHALLRPHPVRGADLPSAHARPEAGDVSMKIHFPVYRRLWDQAKKENRELRAEVLDLRGERTELRIELVVAEAKAEREAERADALEKANDELRADLDSWMDKAVSSDG